MHPIICVEEFGGNELISAVYLFFFNSLSGHDFCIFKWFLVYTHRVLQPSSQLILECFHHLKKKTCSHLSLPIFFQYPPSPEEPLIYFLSL